MLIKNLICGNNQSLFLNLNLIYKTLWTETGSGLLVSVLEKLNLFCLTGLTSVVQKLMLNIIDVIMDGSVLEEKSSFKILRLSYSSKLDCGSYITSIVKTVSDKIGVLIRSMTFFPPEVGLVSLNLPYGLEWNAVVMPGLVLLAATWKCKISYKNEYLGLFFLHLQLLWNTWAIVEMQLAYVFPVGISLVDVCLNWLNWFHFLILVEDLLVILRLHDFSATIARCQQFLSLHNQTLEFFAFRMLSFEL